MLAIILWKFYLKRYTLSVQQISNPNDKEKFDSKSILLLVCRGGVIIMMITAINLAYQCH
jgi:hypothetical protein